MSIKIQIDKKYIITSDTRNFILNRVKTHGPESKHAGKTYLYRVGYFNSLVGAAQAYVDRTIKDSECETMGALIDTVKGATERMELLIKGRVYG